MKNMIITTTNSIDGYVIKKYFKPITASVVIGSNIIGDFLGAMRDFFGGRSGAFEKRINQLYSQAIKSLEQQAILLGANGIVGLKIDVDEINGKNTQMFMITALGTPVIRQSELESGDREITEKHIDGLTVKTKVKAGEFLRNFSNSDEFFTEENMQFIIETGLVELMGIVLSGIKRYTDREIRTNLGHDYSDKKLKMLERYFDALEPEVAEEYLYKEFQKDMSVLYLEKISNIIVQLDLINYARILKMIRSENFVVAKFGLWLLKGEKTYYTEKDKKDIQELNNTVAEVFAPRGSISTKKKLLSSSEKEVWNCECGKVNDMDNVHCATCESDIYGFKRTEITPNVISGLLQSRLKIISELIDI